MKKILYTATVSMEKNKLTDVLEKLDKAKEMLRECYLALEEMGVLTVKEDAASGN